MTEPHEPAPDRYAYSRTALARLVLSYELRDLSDQAANLVPTCYDSTENAGHIVEQAAQLVDQAKEVLQRAVLYARQRHTSWETIGDALDVTRQSAHERFQAAEAEWQRDLVQPYQQHAGRAYPVLHDAALKPTSTGQRLDTWATARGLARAGDEHPVSGHLPALSTTEEMVQVLDAIRHLAETDATDAERAAVIDRKASLLERIAAEDGNPKAAEQAAEARALAAQLKAEIEGTA